MPLEDIILTERKGKSSASSIWTIWLILGLLQTSISMQRRQTSKALFNDLGEGLVSIEASTSSSPRRLATIPLNQSTKFIWNNIRWKLGYKISCCSEELNKRNSWHLESPLLEILNNLWGFFRWLSPSAELQNYTHHYLH